jgi:hypothetical protein
MDFKKSLFCTNVTEIVARNPDWAAEAIIAITAGVQKAIDQQRDDNSKMACILLQYYLREKNGSMQVDKDDKLRAIEHLTKYFRIDKSDL